MEKITFKENNRRLTIGVEMEVQVLDKQTGLLTPRAMELIQASQNPRLVLEFFMSTLEIITGICDDMHEAVLQLEQTFREIQPIADGLGLTFAATGTHPLAFYNDRIVTPTDRYYQLIERNQWITRRMAVYGMHMHIGVTNGDECIRLNNFLISFLSHFLALTASSPFWQGTKTGLMACRPTTFESLPTAAVPYMVQDWKQFQGLYDSLVRSHSIESMKDLWWDIRPSPRFGTLEIRVCDMPATMYELKAVGAYIHLLCKWFFAHSPGEQAALAAIPASWILRENKWRVIRHGLDASFVRNDSGEIIQIRDEINLWLTRLEILAEEAGYNEEIRSLRNILSRGNSAERQLRLFESTQSAQSVVDHNIREFSLKRPVYV